MVHGVLTFNDISESISVMITFIGIELLSLLSGAVLVVMWLIHDLPVATDIVDGWTCSKLGFEHCHLLSGDKFRYFALGVVNIAKYAGTAYAGLNTCWHQPLLDPVDTEGALIDNQYWQVVIGALGREKMPGIVRTRNDAGSTPNATVIPLQHKALFMFEGGLCGTVAHADRVVAVVAQAGHEDASAIWIPPLVCNHNPGSPDTQRDAIFGFTSYYAGHAPNAFPEVNDH